MYIRDDFGLGWVRERRMVVRYWDGIYVRVKGGRNAGIVPAGVI